MQVLVTGGAGYIGSHMCKKLSNEGFEVIVFDNLSNSNPDYVKYGDLVVGDLKNKEDVESLFNSYSFEAVFHFAAYIEVGESVSEPLKYYENNISGSINLLSAMKSNNVKNIVFSSTAAVYGEVTNQDLIKEDDQKIPINPYGESKWAVEKILQDSFRAYDLNSVSLRYFNACGADSDGELGENHDPETHLIPIIAECLVGTRKQLSIFGTDYPTKDGTCVRDFIHIEDLVDAHLKSLMFLLKNKGCYAFNLGAGIGTSIKDLVLAVEKLSKEHKGWKKLMAKEVGRRDGDPAFLVADNSKAKGQLNWAPKKTIDEILVSSINWEEKNGV